MINEYASGDPSAYPKVETWKSHNEEGGVGSDCCSWDGVECDMKTGQSAFTSPVVVSITLFNLVHCLCDDNAMQFYPQMHGPTTNIVDLKSPDIEPQGVGY